MKIAIDLSQPAPEKTGIEYYTHELTNALIKIDKENEFLLFSNSSEYLRDFEESSKVKIQIFNRERVNFLWIIRASLFLRRHKVDILISPSNFMFNFWFPRTIQVMHDIIPLTNPRFWPKEAVTSFKKQLKIVAKRANLIGTISHTTRKEFINIFPKVESKTRTIGIGLHEWTKRKVENDLIKKVEAIYNLPEKYILSVGTIQPRKNHLGMIRGFSYFKKKNPEYKYLIVGKKGWMYDSVFNLVKDLNLENDVMFLDYVPEEHLPVIYSRAKALLFCSFAEGFGLPAIEAYSQNVPTVMSDIAVFRESMEGNAFFVKIERPEDIALALEKAIVTTLEKKREVLDKYSWEKVAENIKAMYSTF